MKSRKNKSKKQRHRQQGYRFQSNTQKSVPPISPVKRRGLACTTTGEIFQPIRLHYQVADIRQLTDSFSKLRCMEYDSTQDRWVWLYVEEAEKIKFQNHPDVDNPVVLGEFIHKANDEVVLNLRSIERAIEAIVFFDKYVSRKIAQVTHITIINRLFSAEEAFSITRLDPLFDRTDITVRDPNEITQQLLEIKEGIAYARQREQTISAYIDELARQPEPEIEKFPTNYYEEGVASLRFSLTLRQIVVLQHWQGNTAYTSMDAIRDMMGHSNTYY